MHVEVRRGEVTGEGENNRIGIKKEKGECELERGGKEK